VVILHTHCPRLTSPQFENALRRHNHTGLMHALLKFLAKTSKLDTAKEGAKTKMTERREKAKAKGEAMDED
jgi:ubiquitin carboxyl-terminal hydrolase L5